MDTDVLFRTGHLSLYPVISFNHNDNDGKVAIKKEANIIDKKVDC